MNAKPKLIPVAAPWQVSPSVSNLRIAASEVEDPIVVSVACNLLEDAGRLVRVEVSFDSAVGLRFSRAWSDKEVVREDDYDWSLVPDFDPPTSDGAFDAFHEQWIRTGLCPDPGMYEVTNSPSRVQVPQSEDPHFLILGHDAYVEVFAKAWRWSLSGALAAAGGRGGPGAE